MLPMLDATHQAGYKSTWKITSISSATKGRPRGLLWSELIMDQANSASEKELYSDRLNSERLNLVNAICSVVSGCAIHVTSVKSVSSLGYENAFSFTVSSKEKGAIYPANLLEQLLSFRLSNTTIFSLRSHSHQPIITLLESKFLSMAMNDSIKKPFTIAIVGGGIGGLALAIGLRHQGISVQIYEAASAFAEIGAGIAFGPNAISAMTLIDPAIREAFRRLATKNGFEEETETWINFRCGLGEPTMIAKVRTGDQEKTGLSSVHRARFLDELAALIPKDISHFGKRLLSFQTEQMPWWEPMVSGAESASFYSARKALLTASASQGNTPTAG
jgi:hypothetical protein